MANPRRWVTVGVSLKLYLDVAQTARWTESVATLSNRHPAVWDGSVRLFVLPSLPALPTAQAAFAGTPIALGAQDLHWEDRGAFTGAISGADLKAVGCKYVEIGHAERASVFGEDAGTARVKLEAALRNDLVPILCVGEPVQSDIASAARECVDQLRLLLDDQVVRGELIVAYEPVWAIGSAAAASASHVHGVAAALRAHLKRWGGASEVTIIYGGSAQSGTLSQIGDVVDGLFLGRFAHDPDSLDRILREAEALVA